MLKKLRAALDRARHKLARAVSGVGVAERRVEHHKQRWHHYAERAKKAPTPGAKKELTQRAERAKANTRKWQKRQTKAARRLKYLQLLTDKRGRKKAKWLDAHPQDKYPSKGVVSFDGHEVAAWIVKDILAPARAAGYWHGTVISGYRDPAYSESLCLNMCGAPSCPGLCAGRSSNHSGSVKPAGAVDLTDPGGTVAYARAHGITWHGAGEYLPSDTPHCSSTGN